MGHGNSKCKKNAVKLSRKVKLITCNERDMLLDFSEMADATIRTSQ